MVRQPIRTRSSRWTVPKPRRRPGHGRHRIGGRHGGRVRHRLGLDPRRRSRPPAPGHESASHNTAVPVAAHPASKRDHSTRPTRPAATTVVGRRQRAGSRPAAVLLARARHRRLSRRNRRRPRRRGGTTRRLFRRRLRGLDRRPGWASKHPPRSPRDADIHRRRHGHHPARTGKIYNTGIRTMPGVSVAGDASAHGDRPAGTVPAGQRPVARRRDGTESRTPEAAGWRGRDRRPDETADRREDGDDDGAEDEPPGPRKERDDGTEGESPGGRRRGQRERRGRGRSATTAKRKEKRPATTLPGPRPGEGSGDGGGMEREMTGSNPDGSGNHDRADEQEDRREDV